MALTDNTLSFTNTVKPIITIERDKIDDTSTSLTLCPYTSLNYTNVLNNSTLKLMEHFCGPTEPNNPTYGQLWVDTSGAPDEPDRLKVYINQNPGSTKFMDVAGTVIRRSGSLRHTGQIEAVDDYNKIPQVAPYTPTPPAITPGIYASLDTGTSIVLENPTQISASSMLALRVNYAYYSNPNGMIPYPTWWVNGVEQTVHSGSDLFNGNLTSYINQTITLIVGFSSPGGGGVVTTVTANNSPIVTA